MPREVAIAFPQPVWDEMTAALKETDETAGVLLAGVAEDETRLVYTVNRVLWVPDEYYAERGPKRLSIASGGWVPAVRAAHDEHLQPIFFHTHPGGDPAPSEHDDEVDLVLAGPFRARARVERYASFILGGDPAHPSFTGRVYMEGGEVTRMVRARVVGHRITVLPADDEAKAAEAAQQIHDRQIRAFGSAGQQALLRLRVGVVGAGGTGSSVTEQLIRLGVRDIVSIDDDLITPTNVSRVYGSSLSDEDMPKVEVVKANAKRIGLGTTVTPYHGRIDKKVGLELLRTCDVIFGCTDDHIGRLNLSLLAFHYLVPIIDLGIAIDARGERVNSITGRVTYVGPGEGCLVCAGVVDLARVRDEGYEDAERERLAGEGYAQGLGEPDPSVIAYTTLVAAQGVADLLERLFGFGTDDIHAELRLRIADRKMKGRSTHPEPGHICAEPAQWARGDQTDFLGQRVWPA